jgi:hypothetical protein
MWWASDGLKAWIWALPTSTWAGPMPSSRKLFEKFRTKKMPP